MSRLRAETYQAGNRIKIFINGKAYDVNEGETLLAALTATGHKTLRHSRKLGEPRGALCGMGVCYECLVTINNRPNQKACMTRVEDRMEVLTDEA
jgi:D-hydroxyproline dehydrogenase subunit gamma